MGLSHLQDFHQEEWILSFLVKFSPNLVMSRCLDKEDLINMYSSFQLKSPFLFAYYNNFSMNTASSKLNKASKRVYKKISLYARAQLVSKVINQGNTISKAASGLKIALSTAKLIVKRFRETGTYFLRRDDKKFLKKAKGNAQKEEEFLLEGPELTSPDENGNSRGEIQADLFPSPLEYTMVPSPYYWQQTFPMECLYYWTSC